jgi:hypothetical protein
MVAPPSQELEPPANPGRFNLLNNLHSMMGSTPLVLFCPGRYDGQTLQLFGILNDNPYYRAFSLVD